MPTIFVRATDYLTERLSHIYVNCGSELKTFKEYLNSNNEIDYYFCSACALLMFTQDAILVRGCIDNKGHRDLPYGWIVFKFKGEEFIFDPVLPDAIRKKDYYSFFEPLVLYEKTKKEILQEFLCEKYAVRLGGNVWQFKDNINAVYPSAISNGYLPDSLSSMTLEFKPNSKTATKIVAHSKE